MTYKIRYKLSAEEPYTPKDKRSDGFIFSSDIEDWISSKKKKHKERIKKIRDER